MEIRDKMILISAGGTGGHMLPAASLARDLVSRGFRVEIATDWRGHTFEKFFGGLPMHVLKAGTLRSGVIGKFTGPAALVVGIAQAYRLIDKLKPVVVIGFGGYPSFPAVYAAQNKKIPTILHEQNAVLGRANVALSKRAERIALSLPHVEGVSDYDQPRIVVTGNPVREEIGRLYALPYPLLQADGPLRIFVMGGSLGAKVFSVVVPAALARLPAAQRARIEIIQQCRAEDIDSARDIYARAGIRARLETFFNDVPELLASSHLVISRSGASTVAEVTTAGRPAIFVPYPHHADQQQKANAETVADQGGAWVMTEEGFTEDALLTRIETFLQNPETLFRAAESARSCGRPDAARRLGNLVVALASGWDHVKTYDLED
jgi:UDP-N-acetylglucosamine--N-acetylmuramyl-(pentapeptide) pyrophosphoryl-undecaprenol N-acetylglucosamine transferase